MENADALSLANRSGLFSRTRWSLVARAAESLNALDELLAIYWYPLYAWARRRGHSPEDASDGVQSFLAKVCERNLMAQADAGRGKLRSWLLKSFTNHLATEHERAHRQKRGGDATHIHIDWTGAESAYLAEPTLASSPEALYARTWALSRSRSWKRHSTASPHTTRKRIAARSSMRCFPRSNPHSPKIPTLKSPPASR